MDNSKKNVPDNGKILAAALELVQAMNKQADKMLPKEIADIVKLHSVLAVGSTWIPIPGASLAASAASIWGMYVRINGKLNLPFKENVIKSVASGVATNLASAAVGLAAADALKWIPGIGSIASGIIMSAVVYACTLVSGYVYLKALTLLAKQGNGVINENRLGDAVKEVMKDTSTIKSLMKEAKEQYRK